jgi:ribonuclease BN (tRNA processing enzyme)
VFLCVVPDHQTNKTTPLHLNLFCSAKINPVSMKVTFLGTNGWYDTRTGNTCSVLIQSKEYDIILDAGNGLAKADQYITQDKPAYLFISHFHIDHIAGLHMLVKFRFSKGLVICGQVGTTGILNSFVAEPFTVPFAQLPFPVRFLELDEGEQAIPFPVESLPLVHPVPCYGYRLTLDGKIITYCTDTGYCDNAIRLGRNSDLLITECGLKSGQESPGWPHLNPETALQIAKEAHAKRLALTHFGAEVYKSFEDRAEVQRQFQKECPGLIVATDDLTIEI